MIYATDIECAKCGGNLHPASMGYNDEGVFLIKLEPCAKCCADSFQVGVNQAHEDCGIIYKNIHNPA